ncbi:MAG TPA: polysaccharide deacetylase family protein [Pyrinomonadaceae bacterium]|jgi:peptidoglycan/xylan/chitin deacetylase (PgdA/CDA1 family)|nr:polysaccharide deacetylase family protein [Pyrinomonadaceae bacterium]
MFNVLAPTLGSFIPPVAAGACVVAAGASCAYYATYAVRSQWLGAADWRGREDTSSVALTFDDGPGEDTARVLDALAAHGARATFFMVGRQAERNARTARRVAAEGHEVGNHSYTHPIYLYRSARETRRQLALAQGAIEGATEVRPRFARPPCGVRSPAYFRAARALELRTVQWSVAGFDWKPIGAREIARHVLKDARAGSIILLHDGDSEGKADRRETVAALPLIFEGLKERGLKVAPLSRLLGIGEAAAELR